MKIKKWITNNWQIKLISVLLAAIIWVVVVNVDDPVQTVTIPNISIEIANDDLFREQGKTYTVVGSLKMSVRVTQRRSVTSRLSASDFKAVADFSDIYQEGQVPVKVTCPSGKVSSTDYIQMTQSLEIQAEELKTVTQKVTVQTNGEPAEGYMVGETSVSPNEITITAPASFANKIRKAVVNVDVSGISEEVNSRSSIQLLDAYGDVMATGDLAEEDFHISSEEADAKVEILNIKSVPINVSVGGIDQVASGYRYTGYEVNPEKVAISGLKSVLGKVTIEIPADIADVAGARGDVTKTVSIKDYLPEGVSLVDGEKDEITITLKVEPLQEREFQINVSDLQLENVGAGLTVEFVGQEVTVKVRGLEEDLKKLEAEGLTGHVDLDGVEAGIHPVQVDVGLPDAFELVEKPTVTVRLVELATEPVSGETSESSSEPENDRGNEPQ
jgi:YbbR domain-containing protein